jgi:NADH-quinone oxidoreductase subunit E
MLTEQDKQEIRSLLDQYPCKRAGAADALKVVQRRYGYVSDEHLRETAGLLGMTADELDGVATFYSLIYRRPVGRHVILMCDSVSCWIMGYERLRDHLFDRLGISQLGGTSPDGRFTLLPATCLGACDRAPALMIDEDLHGDLDEAKIDSILNQYE